jgi:tetratricopeptide (TPR) repeat protein
MKFLNNLTASLLFLYLSLAPAFSETMESAYAATQKGDFEKSLRIITPLAQEGNSEAQLLLGMHHMMGLGTNTNPEVAIEWYQQAADQNNANALAVMASIYRDGVYKQKDVEQAIRLFIKSGKLGNYRAFDVLGIMFEEADGVDQDYLKSLMWYEISIANGGDRTLKGNIVRKMAAQEIQTAAKLAQRCMDSDFKNCRVGISKEINELYCSLTNVQGGVLGQNDSWPRLGENAWSKIVLDKPVPVEKSGQENLGQGMLLNYQTVKIENIDEVISASLFLDVAVPGFEGVNSINRYSQLNLRLQYRCFDQRLSFIRNIVGEY